MYSKLRILIVTIVLATMLIGCGASSKSAPVSVADNEDQSSDIATAPTNTPVPTMKAEAPTKEPAPTDPQTKEPSPTDEPVSANNTWKKILGGPGDDTLQRVIMTKDGGYLLVGSTNVRFDGEMSGDIYLLKTDADGEVLWERTYGDDGYLFAQIVYPMPEGLLLSGVKSSADTQGQDVFVLQLDQAQNEVWTKIFGGPLNEFAAAWPLEDGGYMLGGNLVDPNDIVTDPGMAGYAGFAGRSNVYLAKVDAAGNEIWSRTFGGDENVIASAGVPTKDGGFVIMANIVYFPEPGDDILLLKVDQNGNEIWSRTWEEGSLSGFDLIETSDGNYLIAGAAEFGDDPAAPKSDYIFINVDPEGNEIWSTILGDPDMIDYSCIIVETLDGGYLSAGEYTKDLFGSPSDISLVKLDADGQVVWQNKIKMATHNMFANLLQHPDGGFVLGGSTVRGSQFDIFLIKIDAEGNVE